MHVQSNGGWLGCWLGGRLAGWVAGWPAGRNSPPPPAGWRSSTLGTPTPNTSGTSQTQLQWTRTPKAAREVAADLCDWALPSVGEVPLVGKGAIVSVGFCSGDGAHALFANAEPNPSPSTYPFYTTFMSRSTPPQDLLVVETMEHTAIFFVGGVHHLEFVKRIGVWTRPPQSSLPSPGWHRRGGPLRCGTSSMQHHLGRSPSKRRRAARHRRVHVNTKYIQVLFLLRCGILSLPHLNLVPHCFDGLAHECTNTNTMSYMYMP